MDVIVGLSGGVDSAVAARLLQQQGHRVRGLFMKNWDEDDEAGHCPAAQDLADARIVAQQLGIELLTASFSAQYWNRVFSQFLDEYAAGRTPSPDIVCNREIKFRAFLDHARTLGAERIATGHYARIEYQPAIRLLCGVDPGKDQSYFLHLLDQAQLAHSLFPLGGLYKREVREIARNAGFANAGKKDSTGICFIGERRFSEFLARYLQKQPGEIRTLDETVIGRHHGLMFHTIGQRQGLGIGGNRDSSGQPWYVARKDTATNVLYVVQGGEHPALYARGLRAGRLHWIAGHPPAAPYRCTARIRHRQALQESLLLPAGNGNCSVLFDAPQRAIAPGQSVVFYRDEECLGGAIIEQALVDA
jgi:tRNA-specific 2-thiouridylase